MTDWEDYKRVQGMIEGLESDQKVMRESRLIQACLSLEKLSPEELYSVWEVFFKESECGG